MINPKTLRGDFAKTLLYAEFATDHYPRWVGTKLTESLAFLLKYYERWRIVVNTSKSMLTLFRRPAKSWCTSPNAILYNRTKLMLNGENIGRCSNMKYLGVWFTQLFKFEFHLNVALRKMNMAYSEAYADILNPFNINKHCSLP